MVVRCLRDFPARGVCRVHTFAHACVLLHTVRAGRVRLHITRMAENPKTSGGRHVAHYSFVLTDYHPSWLGFERWCGTMADDECEHGKTPAERIADPSCCTCGDYVRYPRDRA